MGGTRFSDTPTSPLKNKDKTKFQKPGGAKSGALCDCLDNEQLADVVSAWA